MVSYYIENSSHRVAKKVNTVIDGFPKHKRMLVMSLKHFTFKCQSQIKRNVVTFDDTSVTDQDVNQMATHQIRFDDGIFFFFAYYYVVESLKSV